MVYVNIRIKNVNAVRRNFLKFNKELGKNLVKNNSLITKEIRDKARAYAPNFSGKLRRAIVRVKIGGGDKYAVISKAPPGSRRWNGQAYNIFQEGGVRPNPLWRFVPGFGMVRAGNTMRPSGGHPGFPAKRFMFKAYKWAEAKYPRSVRRTVSMVIKKVFTD